jgi:hypothetical protein
MKGRKNSMPRLEEIALQLMECRQRGLSDEQISAQLHLPLATIQSYETGIKRAIQKLETRRYAPSDIGFSLTAACVLATYYQSKEKPTTHVYRPRGEVTLARIKESQEKGNLSYRAIAMDIGMNYGHVRKVMIKAGLEAVHLRSGGGVQKKEWHGPPITLFHRAQVCALRAQGMKYREIAAELSINQSWACQLYQQEQAK